MSLIAETIFIDQFDNSLGAYRIENKIQKGELVAEERLRAFRPAKEEIIYVWLSYVRKIVQMYFTLTRTVVDDKRMFEYDFPEALWANLQAYLTNLKKMPIWVNREASSTLFGGKQTYAFWQQIFETGKSPQEVQVLPEPMNLIQMINSAPSVAAAVS
jgi:hypothetical protein